MIVGVECTATVLSEVVESSGIGAIIHTNSRGLVVSHMQKKSVYKVLNIVPIVFCLQK